MLKRNSIYICHLFYEKAKKGFIYDNKKRFKDFLSVQKFSQILIMIIKKDLRGTYNVSIGRKIYLNQIIKWLNKYNKKSLKLINHILLIKIKIFI